MDGRRRRLAVVEGGCSLPLVHARVRMRCEWGCSDSVSRAFLLYSNKQTAHAAAFPTPSLSVVFTDSQQTYFNPSVVRPSLQRVNMAGHGCLGRGSSAVLPCLSALLGVRCYHKQLAFFEERAWNIGSYCKHDVALHSNPTASQPASQLHST
ncbi:hypothetical protein IWX49DRAFT_413963 [Phyllosticta citricarpa]